MVYLMIIFLFLIWIETHSVIYNMLLSTYKKLRQTSIIKYKNTIFIFFTSMKILLMILYTSFMQKINNNVKKIKYNTFEISYVINGNLYKIVKTIDMNNLVLQVFNESQEDITDKILPYIGPSYDFHGSELTPLFFGHKSLTFELFDGNEIEFTENENIKLKFNIHNN